MDIIDRINELEEEITKHNIAYFVENNPIISDEDFDNLTRELKTLNSKSPVLHKILPAKLGKKIKHKNPMLSLQKAYAKEEIVKWLKDMRNAGSKEIVLQMKFDGIAGKYVKTENKAFLVTRGDGVVGENISDRMPFIHTRIDEKLIRLSDVSNPIEKTTTGEICINKNEFNEYLSKKYKNYRNALGVLKSKNLNDIIGTYIEFVPHNRFSKKFTIETLLNENNIRKFFNEYYKKYNEKRSYKGYPIDGLVLKIVETGIRKELGDTSHHPRWAIAIKFENPVAKTKYICTEWQVGRSGVITPVGIVEPVDINGYTIRRVTLHNLEIYHQLFPQVGDTITIERAGDVIPKIVKVEKINNHTERPLKEGSLINNTMAVEYGLPNRCPECSGEVKIKKPSNTFILKCNNFDCGGKKLQNLTHFAKIMEIEDLSEKRLQLLMELKLIDTWVDIYRLNEEDLMKAEGFKETLSQKIVENIENTRHNIDPVKFIAALGIAKVGKNIAKLILEKFSLTELFEIVHRFEAEMLDGIDGIGQEISESFADGIKRQAGNIYDFRSEFQPNFIQPIKNTEGKLFGKSFCITGTLSKSRKHFQEMIEVNGGTLKGVGKDLDFLVLGDDPGSKLQKAQKYGVKIISEEELTRMVQNG